MSQVPASSSSGRDVDPARELPEPVPTPDWMSEEDWQAWCDASAAVAVEPGTFEDEFIDPAEDDIAAVIAEAEAAAAQEAAAAAHIAGMGETPAMSAVASSLAGRRGPGQPGSEKVLPGVYSGPGGGFATGQILDTAPGCGVLFTMAERVAGDDDRFTGVTDDELLGVMAAADRSEASACALKHAAAGEFIRRRPSQKGGLWAEFTERELGSVLADSFQSMEGLLELAHDLDTKLPGTRALFRSGVINQYKAHIIAAACGPLDADEAAAAEAIVLGRAGRLTPASLRAAINGAVKQVNAEKAKKRREAARKHARVQLWPESSGNAAIEARELPVAEGQAIDQRVSWWARQLKKAGLEGSFDELRAQAFADLMLARDSRPGQGDSGPGDGGAGDSGPGDGGSGGPGGTGGPGGPSGMPAGFVGRVNLTIPAATILELADRPGEFGAVGPVDAWLARDLAAAAAANPRSSWCVTITDADGHAIGHGCARPEPRNQRKPRSPGDHDPPGFSFTPQSDQGPPGGYGIWRLRTPGDGPDFLITLESFVTDPCDHRFENSGHDPGVKLRHLTEIRYARCTAPGCRRPAAQCDYEHNVPYEADGRTCLCNGDPKCRRDHRLKQDPRWKAERQPDGTLRWTTPSGRQFTTEPTRYPI
jgi:hypothetical protein